ncbi:hypothetical protein [Dokdonella sp.]|uniref:hypothetical protein n=1 Tax=Dokdonella sp. TaxID=2291710 RepID=UPI0027BA3B50|nr:hypothetical protein [Dokdonella sp.]
MKKSRKPYNDRTDLEKLQSQWWKLSGLNSREEWSAAVVRAATAAEIAANIAIRSEFQSIGSFPSGFVDSLLIWANGLKGKLERLLVPITKDTERAAAISGLNSLGLQVNNIRNGIAHRGEFCSRAKAQDAIAKAKEFIEGIVRLYEPGFQLKEREP